MILLYQGGVLMLKIGCHLSISNGFLGCAKTIKELKDLC